jgi:hypothetical protein
MARHEHRFVATPITGHSVMGFEVMFGWRVECETCFAKPKLDDHVVEIKASWWKEIVPETLSVDIICDGDLSLQGERQTRPGK